MKTPLKVASICLVALVMAAWFALSNHCVIGAATAEMVAPPASGKECPFHARPSAPAKPKTPANSPCCRIVRAIVAKPVKNPDPVFSEIVRVEPDFAELIFFRPPKIFFLLQQLDTGPPARADSFVELILQESLLAHAPPRFA